MKAKKRGIYEKIINIVLDILIVIFGLILLVSIYKNVQIKILGNKYSSFFGYTTFEVQTGSMADTINPGDWIVVKVTKDIELKDIITFSYEGEFITHRVVETYKDSYITKGDANNGKDEPVNKSQIVGKVVKILPGFGIIRKTFFNPLVLITLIITLYSISFVLRSAKNKNDNSNKKNNYREKVDDIVNLILEKLLDYIKTKIKNKDKEKNEFNDENIENKNDNSEDLYSIDEDLQIVLPEISEEDMDKTLYFRRISVDKQEVDKVDSDNYKEDEYDDILGININVDDMSENELEERVNLVQNKRKKFKNIVEKTMFFKKEEILKIIDVLSMDDKLHTNESTIRETLLNAYIDGKYYNFCGNVNVEFNKRTILSRIDKEIQNTGDDLIFKYTGSDNKYVDKVNKYIEIFALINRIEHINMTNSDINIKRDAYKEKIIKMLNVENINDEDLRYMINRIIKIQKLYQYMINFVLGKVDTNSFKLELKKIVGNKNMYAVTVAHNINFSKVYSDYIVDKTYTEGIIAEDKVMVLLNLLLVNIVKDMLDLEENKKYFIHIPDSIYLKPNKMEKIFKMFEDEYAKNNIVVVIGSDSFKRYNEQVISLRKRGYQFGIVINNDIQYFDNQYIEFADYLFIDKKLLSYSLISNIPDSLTAKIINDDIFNKIINVGGE